MARHGTFYDMVRSCYNAQLRNQEFYGTSQVMQLHLQVHHVWTFAWAMCKHLQVLPITSAWLLSQTYVHCTVVQPNLSSSTFLWALNPISLGKVDLISNYQVGWNDFGNVQPDTCNIQQWQDILLHGQSKVILASSLWERKKPHVEYVRAGWLSLVNENVYKGVLYRQKFQLVNLVTWLVTYIKFQLNLITSTWMTLFLHSQQDKLDLNLVTGQKENLAANIQCRSM
jgi:hypothetical protein